MWRLMASTLTMARLREMVAEVVREALENAAKPNPGIVVSRALCDERSQNMNRQLGEIRWVLRAVGALVLTRIVQGWF